MLDKPDLSPYLKELMEISSDRQQTEFQMREAFREFIETVWKAGNARAYEEMREQKREDADLPHRL